MNDLIHRSDAIKAIQKSTEEYTGFMGMEMYTDEDAIKALMSVPTVDAIPIDYIKRRIAYYTATREYILERYGDCATNDDECDNLLNVLKTGNDCLKDLILVWELAGRLDPDYGEKRKEE